MRYLVIVAEGGLIQDALPMRALREASKLADEIADGLDSEADDVVVWDLKNKEKVYQPLFED